MIGLSGYDVDNSCPSVIMSVWQGGVKAKEAHASGYQRFRDREF